MAERVNFKIVLLGSEEVGKTSILERFAYNRFRGRNPNTIGAAFAAQEIVTKGKRVVAGIWDTAGSERYQSMSRIYYRGASAAVICYDICELSTWVRAKFWISELRRYEENCKVYLCGTKRDLVTDGLKQRQVEYEVSAQHAAGIQAKIIETSSKTGYNVEKLFQMIAEDYILSPDSHFQVDEPIRLTDKSVKRSCCRIV